jgi:hypothetical protein
VFCFTFSLVWDAREFSFEVFVVNSRAHHIDDFCNDSRLKADSSLLGGTTETDAMQLVANSLLREKSQSPFVSNPKKSF